MGKDGWLKISLNCKCIKVKNTKPKLGLERILRLIHIWSYLMQVKGMHGLPCARLVHLSAQIAFLMPTCKARYHPWGPHISYPCHPKHWSPPRWWPLSIPVILVQVLHCICCLSAIKKCMHLHSKTEINQKYIQKLVHSSEKTVCVHYTDKSVQVTIMQNR